jgi:hypothetical protein
MTAKQDELHAAIMNLRGDVDPDWTQAERHMYKIGHRDARHAAAELVIAALRPEPTDGVKACRYTNEPGGACWRQGKAVELCTCHDMSDEKFKASAKDHASGVDSVDEALPYKTPMELWQAFKGGAKFVLRYHGKTFDVTHMEPREKVVYVQPPGMPVKVFPDGRSAEGPSPAIRLAAAGVDTSDGGQHE